MSVIDVHAHFLPAVYLTAMHAAGVHDVEGFAKLLMTVALART